MSSAKHGSHYLWWTQRLRECGAGSMARDVLAVLEVHAGKANGDHPGVAWPSIATIQSLLGVRKNAVLTGLRELKAAGIIRTTPAIAATARRIFTSSLEAPFQVSESDTQTGSNQVSRVDTQTDSLGIRSGADQVSDSRTNQVPDLCLDRAKNVPTELTIEQRTYVDEKSGKNDDAEFQSQLAAALRRLPPGYEIDVEKEVRTLMRTFTASDDRALLLAWLDPNFIPDWSTSPIGYVIARVRGGGEPSRPPTTARKSNQPAVARPSQDPITPDFPKHVRRANQKRLSEMAAALPASRLHSPTPPPLSE